MAAIPHTRGSQYGIPTMFGRVYVQAPNIIAVASASAPEMLHIIKRSKSSLFLKIDNIKILVINRIPVNSGGLDQNRETENSVIKASKQLYEKAFSRRFIKLFVHTFLKNV